MPTRAIKPRDLIIDNYGRKSIVVERHSAPLGEKWLARQKDTRMRDPSLTLWWRIQPLTGGSGYTPDARSELVGEATPETVFAAVLAASPAGANALRALFPELYEGKSE